MNTFMTKRRVLLTRISDATSAVQVFEYKDEDIKVDFILREKHKMPRDIWEEMGSPDTISITVEPGDTLNTEE